MSTATSDYPALIIEWLPDQGPGTADGSWVDITDYVQAGQTFSGRQYELDRFQAGTLSLTLATTTRLFDPEYTSGTYYGQLVPMRQIRVKATWNSTTYPIWRGYITDWGQTVVHDKVFYTTIQAKDAFAWFEMMGLPGSWFGLEVAADRPDHWYRLDEKTGTTAADSGFASARYPGTYMGTPTLDSATVVTYDGGRKGVALDGAADYVQLNPTYLADTSDNFTLEIWFTCASAPSDTVYLFAGGGQSLGGGPLLSVGITSSGYATVTMSTTIGAVGTVTGAVDLCDGIPHQIAVTGDGTTLTLFVDGASVGTDGSYSIGGAVIAYLGCWSYYSLTSMFTGTIAEFAWWSDDLTAARILAHYTAGKTAHSGDDTGTILGRVLDAKGWPSALRDIDVGNSIVGAYELPSTNVLDFVQMMADTEAGQTYIGPDGKFVHRSRGAVASEARSTVSQATFGDNNGAATLIYVESGFSLTRDEALIRNPITATRSGGATGIAANATNITKYGERAWAAPTAYDSDDDVMTDRALVFLNRYKEQATRLESMTIRPRRDATGLWPQVLGRLIGDLITVQRTPLDTGNEISVTQIIEAISHRFAPRDWTTVYRGSPNDTTSYALYTDGVIYDDGTLYGY